MKKIIPITFFFHNNDSYGGDDNVDGDGNDADDGNDDGEGNDDDGDGDATCEDEEGSTSLTPESEGLGGREPRKSTLNYFPFVMIMCHHHWINFVIAICCCFIIISVIMNVGSTFIS